MASPRAPRSSLKDPPLDNDSSDILRDGSTVVNLVNSVPARLTAGTKYVLRDDAIAKTVHALLPASARRRSVVVRERGIAAPAAEVVAPPPAAARGARVSLAVSNTSRNRLSTSSMSSISTSSSRSSMASGSSAGRPRPPPPLPPRQPEGGHPYEAGVYGNPCIGCRKEFCVNMRPLSSVKSIALNMFSPKVHDDAKYYPDNSKRRNVFYRLYRDHVGLRQLKMVPYCVVQHGRDWFPENHSSEEGFV